MPLPVGREAGGLQALEGESVPVGEGYPVEVETIRLGFLGCSIRMDEGEAGEIVCSRVLSIRQNDAVWSRDSDFVAERRIFGKRYSDGGRKVKSDEAQGGGETDHFHDLKE